MYSLYKVNDATHGDSGPMSMTLWVENGKVNKELAQEPTVGKAIRVGSFMARTFSAQDWFQTSLVEEILDREEDSKGIIIRFRTMNGSIYEWRDWT